MKLNEEEKRMVYQIESTNQNAALNEIYMTWRYAKSQATKDTAESLLKKLRPLSDKECMDVIREVQTNYLIDHLFRVSFHTRGSTIFRSLICPSRYPSHQSRFRQNHL